MDALVAALGEEVADPEEETFLLFSRPSSPSSVSGSSGNLGFIDPKADELEISVAGKDLTIRQFPNLLVSNRAEGTTGAVVWKINPPFADWLASHENNFLFRLGILGADSKVVELGSGVSGVVALSLSPSVGQYIATDQNYVLRHLRTNIENNAHVFQPHRRSGHGNTPRLALSKNAPLSHSKYTVQELDWESSLIHQMPDLQDTNMIIAVDCVYNEALVDPLIRTCADICRFRTEAKENINRHPCICLIGQQLRSEDVFEYFMEKFVILFRVWRVPEDLLSEDLGKESRFVIHVGILR
ncbi:MAG: hypothetical protein M1820_002888 [Bogoriella megaspora]|nr:MAG: hypothetical protein M1820_002888 [Bogoriella megaspora]